MKVQKKGFLTRLRFNRRISDMASKKGKDLLEKLVPVLLIASIALAFTVGVLWQRVVNLEGGKANGTAVQVPGADGAGDGAQPQRPTSGKLSEDQASKVPQVTDNDHVRGSRDAKVYLIEYSDYECPFCARFHSTAQQVVDEYGGDVAWVYRHFPLDQLHSKARPAAQAAECVAEIGGEDAFWKFTDEIFDDITKLSDLASVASSAGVSGGSYDSCVDSEKYKDKVEAQYQAGLTAGITGTPGNLVINDKGEAWLVPGALPLETLKTTIDEALGS